MTEEQKELASTLALALEFSDCSRQALLGMSQEGQEK